MAVRIRPDICSAGPSAEAASLVSMGAGAVATGLTAWSPVASSVSLMASGQSFSKRAAVTWAPVMEPITSPPSTTLTGA